MSGRGIMADEQLFMDPSHLLAGKVIQDKIIDDLRAVLVGNCLRPKNG